MTQAKIGKNTLDFGQLHKKYRNIAYPAIQYDHDKCNKNLLCGIRHRKLRKFQEFINGKKLCQILADVDS